MSKCQLENLLEAFSNLFFVAKIIANIVEILLNNIFLLNKQLQQKNNNKSQKLHQT